MLFQFDSYQNAKNYFEGHHYSNSEKYSDVKYSNNVCKQSPYEKGDMRGQRGLCHIENFVVKFSIDNYKDPLFAHYDTQELINYLIKSESLFSNSPTFESTPLIKDTTIINEETVV